MEPYSNVFIRWILKTNPTKQVPPKRPKTEALEHLHTYCNQKVGVQRLSSNFLISNLSSHAFQEISNRTHWTDPSTWVSNSSIATYLGGPVGIRSHSTMDTYIRGGFFNKKRHHTWAIYSDQTAEVTPKGSLVRESYTGFEALIQVKDL